jgi:hypothetical protein
MIYMSASSTATQRRAGTRWPRCRRPLSALAVAAEVTLALRKRSKRSVEARAALLLRAATVCGGTLETALWLLPSSLVIFAEADSAMDAPAAGGMADDFTVPPPSAAAAS